MPQPCKNGLRCVAGGCKGFHGSLLIKTATPCSFSTSCTFQKTCALFHIGEERLIGKPIWRAPRSFVPRSPRVRTGVPVVPLVLPKPSPLDNPPILQSIAGFLTGKDRCSMRIVSKEVKVQIDSLVPIQEMNVGRWIPRSSQPYQFLKKLTVNENYRESICAQYSNMKYLLEGAAHSLNHLRIESHNFKCYDTLRRIAGLKKLEIMVSHYHTVNLKDLIAALPHLTKLEKFKLYMSEFPKDLHEGLLTSLTQLLRLRSLGFMNTRDVVPFPIHRLVACKGLKHLQLTGSGYREVLEALDLPLEKLSLVQCDLPMTATDILRNQAARKVCSYPFKAFRFQPPGHHLGTMEVLNSILCNCPHLERLVLNCLGYDNHDMPDVRLPHLPNLKKLTVGTTEIRDFQSFCTSIPDGLECLYLHGTSHTTMAPLIANLPRLSLWSLGLNGNPITDLPELCAALTKYAPDLETFGMSCPSVDYTIAQKSLKELVSLKKLHHIYLYSKGYQVAPLTDTEVETLRAEFMKNCNCILLSECPVGLKEQKVRTVY